MNFQDKTIGDLVAMYHAVKNKIKVAEDAFKTKLLPAEETLGKIKADIVESMDAAGLVNVKTEHGTPYFSHPETWTISDPETFYNWAVENSAFDVLPTAITKIVAARERALDGGLPGVEVSTIRKLCVRKS